MLEKLNLCQESEVTVDGEDDTIGVSEEVRKCLFNPPLLDKNAETSQLENENFGLIPLSSGKDFTYRTVCTGPGMVLLNLTIYVPRIL